MLKKFTLALSLLLPLSLTTATGCDTGFTIPDSALKPGGAYITYVQETECDGCGALERGDLIQAVDGNPVATSADIRGMNLTDGQPHELTVYDRNDKAVTKVTITANPNNGMPPLKDAPPFWAVGASELMETPTWARRRLFGHASPQLLLVNVDGGFVNGRDLYGKKRLIVFFDWSAATERQDGALIMQVLQKAQADLNAAGVDLVFAQIRHPNERARAPMNDTDLRQFFTDNQVNEPGVGQLPPPPMYRMPNKTEDNPTRVLGMEGAFTYLEAIGEAPNIFVMDEGGVIRWHSAGKTPDPSGEIKNETVYTINEAVLFALKKL
ncbi:hypothetical protein PPSIR1_34043 [Plesiocystis pacifica SIR-1]|uniref:PDZ domain-containing protein n=1 Tax=Plesiocystis pacifica SIR-1 TaxID=391625 RepID=A6GG91_9BACT|nr:hypothetical protein [Plesiocystis pacifica]EDM75112.1 hypothetical protein PPSIR1_34043 [Plesiocystis pacifica SIR-1]